MNDMRLLYSDDDLGRWAPGHDEMGPEALSVAYAYPSLSGSLTWVRANMVSTLDGAATGDDGRSSDINTGADRDVFALLRALTDVILVGAGTARVEGYRRAVIRAPWLSLRDARPAHPTTAIATRSGAVPPLLSPPPARSRAGPLTPRRRPVAALGPDAGETVGQPVPLGAAVHGRFPALGAPPPRHDRHRKRGVDRVGQLLDGEWVDRQSELAELLMGAGVLRQH